MTKVAPSKKGRETLSRKKQVTKHQDRVPEPAVENAELDVDEDVPMETPAEHSGQSQRPLRSSASPMTKVGPPRKGRETLSRKKQVTKHQDRVPEPAVENAELDVDEDVLMETPAEHSGQSQRLLRSGTSPMTKVGPPRKGRDSLSRQKAVMEHGDRGLEPVMETTEPEIDEDAPEEMPAEHSANSQPGSPPRASPSPVAHASPLIPTRPLDERTPTPLPLPLPEGTNMDHQQSAPVGQHDDVHRDDEGRYLWHQIHVHQFMHFLDRSSTPTGSDFSETVREKNANRRKRKADELDTDEEDRLDDIDLAAEAVADPTPPRPRLQKGKQRRDNHGTGVHERQASHSNGKQRQADAVAESDEEADDDPGRHDDWKKIPGPLPKIAKERAVQVGRNTRAALAELAQEYGKTIHYMMIQAGLGVRPSRPPNPFNMFKSWFANEYRNECANNVAATKRMYLFTKQYISH